MPFITHYNAPSTVAIHSLPQPGGEIVDFSIDLLDPVPVNQDPVVEPDAGTGNFVITDTPGSSITFIFTLISAPVPDLVFKGARYKPTGGDDCIHFTPAVISPDGKQLNSTAILVALSAEIPEESGTGEYSLIFADTDGAEYILDPGVEVKVNK
jgi:hypothetical protein